MRIMNIMKILEFHVNHEQNESFRIPRENYENHENHRISLEHEENNENHRIQ